MRVEHIQAVKVAPREAPVAQCKRQLNSKALQIASTMSRETARRAAKANPRGRATATANAARVQTISQTLAGCAYCTATPRLDRQR